MNPPAASVSDVPQMPERFDELPESSGNPPTSLENRDALGMTPLARAAFHGDIEAMKMLVSAGADMQTRTDDGASLLHLAVYRANEEVLQWLIANGARLDVCDRWDRRPLEIVLVSHRFAYGDLPLKHRLAVMLGGNETDVVQRGAFHRHPLHLAIARLDIETVTQLLDAGTSPDIRDETGETALRFAIDNHDGPAPMVPRERRAFARKLLPLLIRHGADADQRTPGSMLTYREHADNRGIGDVLDRLMRRYRPRSNDQTAGACTAPTVPPR